MSRIHWLEKMIGFSKFVIVFPVGKRLYPFFPMSLNIVLVLILKITCSRARERVWQVKTFPKGESSGDDRTWDLWLKMLLQWTLEPEGTENYWDVALVSNSWSLACLLPFQPTSFIIFFTLSENHQQQSSWIHFF